MITRNDAIRIATQKDDVEKLLTKVEQFIYKRALMKERTMMLGDFESDGTFTFNICEDGSYATINRGLDALKYIVHVLNKTGYDLTEKKYEDGTRKIHVAW